MKKRRVQVIAGIMTAGMLVMTGCGSAQTAEGETTAEPVVVEEAEPAAQAQSVDAIVTEPEAEAVKEATTEVVESDMEVTESSLSGTVAQGQATNFKSFDELLDYYRSQGGYSYAKLYLFDVNEYTSDGGLKLLGHLLESPCDERLQLILLPLLLFRGEFTLQVFYQFFTENADAFFDLEWIPRHRVCA